MRFSGPGSDPYHARIMSSQSGSPSGPPVAGSTASRQPGSITRGAVFTLAFCFATMAAHAFAQTWSSARGWPPLWQIVAIDRSGEAGWPYGQEDVAGDGLAAFADDEAGADLRTVYADADAQRLWLRAYMVSENPPAAALTAFFFLDIDARTDTGGPAQGAPLAAALSADPTHGGYERAIAVRGDGGLASMWEWDAQTAAWQPLQTRTGTLHAEVGRARDPLAIGPLQRAYVQADLAHELSGLNASCAGLVFVRLRYDSPPRSFGDDAPEDVACRPQPDAYGDPAILRGSACDADADCPSSGRCRAGACLFTYDCSSDPDCRADERCMAGQCVRVVDGSCNTRADCAGLVCASGTCVACAESGARACSDGLWCAPNGGCVDVAALPSSARVQGGAFHCAALPSARGPRLGWGILSVILLSSGARRRRRFRARACARREARRT